MKEVIAVLRPERWRTTREAVAALPIEEVLSHPALGRGQQRGLRYLRPATEEEGVMPFLPKRVLAWLVPDDLVSTTVEAICQANRTGNYGDGKIFICPVGQVLDIGARPAATLATPRG